MFTKINITKLLLSLFFLGIILASSLKVKAADPVSLSNNYEVVEGSNIDSAADYSGNTYVVYERSGRIYLTKNRETEQLIGIGTTPALALDSLGTPHIAYINSGSVIYETFDGDWDNETDLGIGSGASYVDLDVDNSDKAHIFFRSKFYADSYVDLVYASNSSGTFNVIRSWNGFFDDYGGASGHMEYYSSHPISIKIDAAGNYHLVFWFENIDKAPGWIDKTQYIKYETNIPSGSTSILGNLALYKNSLTIDALGRVHVLYGGVKHGLVSAGAWVSSDLVTGSSPAIGASNSSIAIAYVNSGVYYSENFGSGFSEPTLIDGLGTNPSISTNGTNRFIYYLKAGKIYLATDKTIYNVPVISGVEEGGLYSTSKTVTWDNGLGLLNGIPIISGVTVNDDGEYNLTVTNASGQSTSVSFTIDTTPPDITIDPYNEELTNKDVVVNARTSEGTLNATTHTFTENGSFDFEATDEAGNKTIRTVVVTNIDKTAPNITILPYETNPTNKDITVRASVDEGTLNSESYTFTENGSFTFEATDTVGNKSQKIVTINNIDRLAPVITLSDYEKDPTNQDIKIDATTDEGSLNSSSHTFTENGSFEFVATDLAGNYTTKIVTIANIDKVKPHGVKIISPEPFNFVKQTIAVLAEAQDEDSGISRVEFYSLQTGKIAEDNLAPFVADVDTTLMPDGRYDLYVVAYDAAGNATTSSNVVTSVDNTFPIITVNPYTTDPTKDDIVVTANSNEGGLNRDSYTFTQNGSFDFVAKDPAGNGTTRTVTITNIDKEGPEIVIAPYTTNPTNQNITVIASVLEGTLNFASHTFESNGEFDFIATDSLGNQTVKTVKITNIDKAPPKGSLTSVESGSFKRAIMAIGTEGIDDGLGIDKVEFYHASEPTLIGTDYLYPFSVDWDTTKVEDGVHKLWSVIYDKAGNKAATAEVEINVDNTAPNITLSDYSTQPTTSSITVTASTNEGTLNQSSYTFTKNGSFDFVAVDEAGNKTIKTVTINNIYIAEPTVQPVTPDQEEEATSPENQPTNNSTSQANIVADENSDQSEEETNLAQNGDNLVAQALNSEESSSGEDSASVEQNPEVKGDTTQKSNTGWWRWWYLLVIAVLGGVAYIVIRKRV